jgi:hypothetical protein
MSSSDIQLAQAWDQFCDSLKDAKEVVFRDTAPAAARDRAAGIRMAARLMSLALDYEIENADPLHPELTHMQDWRRKFAGDNPDGLYLTAPINGSETYRISGTRGTVTFVAFSVTDKRGMPTEVLFGHKTLHVEPDGSFEVFLGAEAPTPRPANWMTTTSATKHVLVRQFFNDWENEESLGDLRIDRLGPPIPPPDVSAESVSTGLHRSAKWLNHVAAFWPSVVEKWLERPFEFVPYREMTHNMIDATPGGEVSMFYWELPADEAVIVRVVPPDPCLFWNFEYGNWWFETLDYRTRLVGTNGHYAVREDDGEVIQVVSHADPGVPNWIDASGYAAGYGLCRWMDVDSAPTPTVERVKLAELFDRLPPAVKRIDAAGRQRQLAARRRGIIRRFAGF